MFPLGVVVPTKNSMPYLPRHVAGLRPWLDLAAEVVVVDSHSTDGTVDFLRANLRHPALRFTSHPPGLYASWNHGITQISSEYVYVATTGDSITRDGAGQLVGTLHPTNASAAEKQSHLTARRADAVLRTAMDSWRHSGVIAEQTLPGALWEDLMIGLAAYFDAKMAFDRNRRGDLPWFLNPRAWKNRMQRERAARKLHSLKRVALLGTEWE